MGYAVKEIRAVQRLQAAVGCRWDRPLSSSCCSTCTSELLFLVLFPSAVVAMLGMLSPSSRGALMTTACFLFMFMG